MGPDKCLSVIPGIVMTGCQEKTAAPWVRKSSKEFPVLRQALKVRQHVYTLLQTRWRLTEEPLNAFSSIQRQDLYDGILETW